MDLEAMQILNLSPIPELSEIELSTMLEHLSGLSDVNGDLTDRNVEDILKEAEDLLDRSTSSKTLESRSENKNPEADEKIATETDQLLNVSKDKEQPSDIEESRQQTTSVSSNSQLNTLNECEANKQSNSSVENLSILYSPGSSSNPIKSTIDSLKEFSKLIEKKLAKQSPNTSPKHIEIVKKSQNETSNKEVTFSDSSPSKKSNTKEVPDLKIVKTTDSIAKQNVSTPFDKSVKLLNCFERLYRDKPLRLSSKKPKVVDKVPKTITKKKFSKDLKSNKKNNWESSNSIKKDSDVSAVMYQKNGKEIEEFPKTMISKRSLVNEHKYLFQNEDEDESLQQDCLDDGVELVESNMNESLIQIGAEQTQDRGTKSSPEKTPERSTKDDKNPTETSKPDTDFDRNSGIKRLEEQFCILKEKYNNQIDKLEAENSKLREALNRQQETYTTQEFLKPDVGAFINYPWAKLPRTSSSENCKAPRNSPCSSSEDVLASTKEAYSQTEKNLKNTSIQCSQDSREVGTNSNPEIIPDARKIENKENVLTKKKPGKYKPFSDVNTTRQKRTLEHETQLLATLRGLQAEVSAKDKENRKLKSEIESLKRQMKKTGSVKVENCRRCNIGTQTIGLGVFSQRPYNPENYQVPFEFEKENEDLRSRIKALEEDFEFLKEKRITDLQSLHQVHEEEMAKLVSKLETQSALTKHLHSLLVNR